MSGFPPTLLAISGGVHPYANDGWNMAFGGKNPLATCASINEYPLICAHQVLTWSEPSRDRVGKNKPLGFETKRLDAIEASWRSAARVPGTRENRTGSAVISEMDMKEQSASLLHATDLFSGTKCSYALCDEDRVACSVLHRHIGNQDVADRETNNSRVAQLGGAPNSCPDVKFGGMISIELSNIIG